MIKTKGIIIKTIKYRDTSVITKILTKDIGLKSYIALEVRKKSPKHKFSHFSLLNIVDVIAYNNSQKSINHIIDIRTDIKTLKFNQNPQKNILSLILADILDRSLLENIIYENIFSFIYKFILNFKNLDINPIVFLINFLIEYSKHLGFGIHDLKEVEQELKNYDAFFSFDIDEELLLKHFIKYEINNIEVPNKILLSVLRKLILFYKIYCPSIENIKSLKIFEELVS